MSELAVHANEEHGGGGSNDVEGVIKPDLLPFTGHLGTIDEFAIQHPRYPACIVTVYQIVRDLHIKQELTEIEIVDAKKWQRHEYFIEAKLRTTGKIRLMIPFYLDAEVDLPWLQDLALESLANDKELYICVHTPETIIYQLVTTELP